VSTIWTSTTATTGTTFTSSTSTSVQPANITISIKVVNNQANPVQGVNVTIPSLGLQGLTNSQGLVTFTLPPGTYPVTFSQGSNSATQSISPSSNGQQFTVTLNTGAGIPGFPVESIIAGVVGGVVAITLLRRRRKVR
jgi:hypothetical protein